MYNLNDVKSLYDDAFLAIGEKGVDVSGTFPTVGTLPYESVVINNKYLDGDYGDWSIPADSVLAGAGYWEDGFSFGWDIDGKPRNATHCSIGAYEPVWA